MILYSFRRCPYAMRARMALQVAGMDYEHREIALRDKPAAMLAASPKGSVPVLVTDDGVIDESLDIADWALARNDPQNWLDGTDRALIARNDGPFKHHLDRYKYVSRYGNPMAEVETLPNGRQVDLAHGRMAGQFIRDCETRLSTRAFLTGDRTNLTDIAIFPFVRQFAAVRPDVFARTFPNTQAWLSKLTNGDLFAAIMRKHALWKDDETVS